MTFGGMLAVNTYHLSRHLHRSPLGSMGLWNMEGATTHDEALRAHIAAGALPQAGYTLKSERVGVSRFHKCDRINTFSRNQQYNQAIKQYEGIGIDCLLWRWYPRSAKLIDLGWQGNWTSRLYYILGERSAWRPARYVYTTSNVHQRLFLSSSDERQ